VVSAKEIREHENVLDGSRLERHASASIGSLSRRERDVLALASRGMTNGQIASQLSLSVHGVKFHLASIFRKLEVDNRTAAAALYLSEPQGAAD
jgi:DNA-binding CsgD family transcriptional regulator